MKGPLNRGGGAILNGMAHYISASFKDSSVVGQNYQRAHQGCS